MSPAYFRVQRQCLLRNMSEMDGEHDVPLAYPASQALSTYRRLAVPLMRLLAPHTSLSAILATIPKEGSQIENGINCVK